MNVSPIPRQLLPSTMTVREPDVESDYEGAWLDPYTVTGVRFERAEALDPNEYRLAEGATGRVWVDAVNSDGARRVPVGSRLDIDGDRLHVVAVAEYRPFGEVHHWEVDVR